MAIPSQMRLNDERNDDGLDIDGSFHISIFFFSLPVFLDSPALGSPAKVSSRGNHGFRPFICCKYTFPRGCKGTRGARGGRKEEERKRKGTRGKKKRKGTRGKKRRTGLYSERRTNGQQ